MPFTLAVPAHHQLIIKKSQFIACVEPMADRASAQARVAALRAEHPGAAHVCWALLAGGQSAAVDDGEPSGTAGRPMLEVLRHQQLEGVLASERHWRVVENIAQSMCDIEYNQSLLGKGQLGDEN
jgi:putative IMPACT (imprinted ancient) family translation regulator